MKQNASNSIVIINLWTQPVICSKHDDLAHIDRLVESQLLNIEMSKAAAIEDKIVRFAS
jgi:hypothetical protein